ncbi:hypothetical protein F383_30540 [Gossypium arboreum]|uniref:Uncharacterized protein n=1 Tax=Gossypium arboreum TaxID=29729 RepID=A0A0B0PLA4_GOSAR|nr:hypothetical protein F383_30540 [Gossypium arboreum]
MVLHWLSSSRPIPCPRHGLILALADACPRHVLHWHSSLH